jgi:hypothetical protein
VIGLNGVGGVGGGGLGRLGLNIDKKVRRLGGNFRGLEVVSGVGSGKRLGEGGGSGAGGGRGEGGGKSMVANYSSIGFGFGGKDDYVGRKNSESRRYFSPNMGRNGVGKNVFSMSGARVIFLTEFLELQLIGWANKIFIINF